MTLLEKPALTEALQQLSALLPVALETCTGSESESQNSAVVEKVRSVLLDVIGTITCTKGSGKQVLAVLKILQIVMDKLPAAFSTPVPQFMLTISVVQLLGRLGCHSGAVEEQHVPILCGLAHLVQHNDRQVLLELHASTVDLLLDLEHLLFEMAAPSSHAASLRLPLFHGLLIAAQERLTEAAQQQPSEQNCGSQEQQTQQLIAVEPVMVVVQDGATWQAYASLALRFLLFQLQEYPVVLGAITPPALVSAVSQMLSYPSSELQELCLNTMAIMVVQQAQRGALVLSVMQHVAWLLECAAADQIPADICTSSWQLAAAGCLAPCVTELSNLGLLDAVGDKLVNCLCTAVSADALQCQRTLWLSLLRDVLVAIPSCSAAAALALPLTLLPAEPQTATVTDFAAAEAALIDVWQVICSWAASEGIVGVIDRQAQLVYPGLRSSAASVTAATGEASGDMGTGSPVKKKRKKLKQAQLTVSEGGFLSSQRPGRPSNSQQPSDTTPVATQTPPAELAADTLQQLLRQQHPDTVATAATRLAGLIACLGPNTPVPATFAAALGLPESTGSATGNIDSTGQTPVPFATFKVRLLQSILYCLLAASYQSPALLACVAQQVIAWLPQLSVQQDLVDQLLPALLLALVATAGSVVATPVSADIHRATWQAAVDWMQGASSLWSTGLAGPPSPLLAAISVAWLTLAKLINRNSNTSVSTASAQMHACCTSSHPASVVAAVQLLPVMCLTQHGYFEDAGAQEQCPAVANTAAQQQLDPLRHNQQHSLRLQLSKEGYQQSLHSLLGFLPTPTGKDAAAIQLSAVQAVSQVLHVAVGAVAALQVAGWLRDATAVVMQLQGLDLKHNITGGRGISTAADGGQGANILDLISGYARSGSSSFPGIAIPTSDLLPPLRDLVPVLEALTIPNNSDNSTAVQCAALHFLGSYLTAVNDSDHLSGSRQQLLDALQLITSRDSRVRDTALKLVQQYLKPAVLQEAFGAEEHRHDKQHDEDDVTTTPHGRLLQHLQQLSMQLSAASETAGSRQQLTGVTRAPESVVAAKTSLLRAVAGLYGGLLGSGCEHFPLLYLLEHQCPVICPDDRVQACALDLLQFLANQYASSKDPGQLLLDSQATPALLTYVGKALARQPQLFTQLALAAKVDEGQLAEAVAPYVVHWLCQKKLTEALQLLASKLGQSASSLFLSKSDEVLAEQLWFNPDGLASLIEWVDALLAPDNTFLEVVRVMGRRMARCVIQTAGLAQFWGEQHRPPKEVLARASEYVGILADVMKSEGVRGVAGLLQGETMATLLKIIGKTLSKQQQQVLAPGTRPSSKQQQQQQHLTAAQADQEAFFAEKLQGLRSLMVMMYLLGDAIGSHALQLMAVLSEALLYCTSGALLVQALSGWLSFIQLLAQWAPEVLQRVAAQAAVVLLPVLELTSQPSSSDGSAAASAVKDSAVQLAAAVLHEMVVRQRASVKPALKNMPPLPTLDNLKEVNAVLAQEQDCQTPLQKLQLLVAALRHESVAVRHVGLGEVRNFLLQYKTFMGDAMTGLLNCSGPAAPPGTATAGNGRSSAGKTLNSASTKLQPQQCRELHSELLSALLASCDNLPRTSTHLVDSMKQRCAQCLGMLGAIDPAHVSPELPSPTPFAYNAEAYLVVLVQQHLVRVLQTACDIGQLEVTSYAIQQILQHYTRTNLTRANKSAQAFETVVDDGTIEIDADPISPDEPGSLYSLLDNTSQSIVRPFLTTKFCVTSRPPDPPGVVFGKAPSFRRWLHAWLKVLMSHTSGPLSFAFEACRGVAFWDQPLMLYLLPFMLVEVAGQGGEGLQLIVQELTAVMQSAASGPECQVDNIELYVHCIFNQLDLLKQWVQEQQDAYERAAERAAQQAAQQAAAAGNNRSVSRTPEPQLPTFVVNVSLLVNAVPIQIMAEAALRCGSYARALQYFEVHVRGKYGGGLNPSAYEGGCDSYTYDDVSSLLEVYGHLEEPDGLAGLVQLRQGGLTAADQILVAEKAGDWSEALALYEQALAQEAAAARAAATAGPEAAGSAAPGAVAADALTLAARAVAAGSVTWSNFNAGSGQIHRLGVFDQRATGSRDLPVLQLGTDAGPDVGAPAAAQGAATAVQQVVRGISSLQVGHLRCLLHMGHHQTLLHQVDGLMARCLGSGQGFSGSGASAGSASDTLATLSTLVSDRGSAAAQSAQWCITQLAALGVAASWRLGAFELLRGYLGIVEAASLAGLMRGSSEDDWEACVGYILEAAHRGSDSDVTMMIKAARQGILSLLPFIAGESYTRAYPDLMKLHMLQEIEDAWGLIKQGNAVGPLQRSRALRWPERLSLTAPMLSSRAPLLALRRQLAGLLKDSEGMGRAWLQHAKLCRSTGHQEAAETSILEAQARNVPGALLERCRLLWDRDKGHRAVMELQLVVQQQLENADQPNDPVVQHQRAKELLQLTEWMSAVGQGGKEVLCANYDDAIQLDYNWEKAHFSYACYLDQLYKDAKQREGKGPKNGMDRLGGRCRVRREEESPFDYLPVALSHYGESIRAGHKHILQSLPRLLTLYFEFGNRLAATKSINQKMRNAQVQISGVMKALVRSIPTYKWLLVLPQLTSRLCHQEKDVQEFIQTVLVSIVDQFPQQALWSMTMVVKSTVRARQEIATAIISSARRRCNESGRRLFDSFSKLMDQLIRTCMWQPPSDKRMSRASAQREFKALLALLPVEVQVPVQALFTVDLPPGGKLPSGHRPISTQATIAGMKDEVVIMQSLMKPKKITFIGSDGVEYPFLAKPKDDLRKDYRLMDFAGTLNALFARQPQARRRGLSLRTYAVLPLTNDCGILQWVNNLVPFKHACEEVYVKEKIYKRHSTPMQIKKMYDSHSGTRRELMDKVLSLLPPRMSKWFLSKFSDPGAWLKARLAFTRTNAAWAMVGHVLGLGDRHGENIMINALTGETMHVDFGCLFDHGLTLEVPEMVPFRLTQNVVDCFGVSGVEGTFRCAAEMTLQVLRDNKATLMTCAETFLHDPLVDWTKGSRSSSTSSSAAAGQEHENPQAKDALFVMEGRLSGTLLGVLATPTLPLSCEGQAARLIQEASDHENLGKMYIWWMPWL